MNSRHFTLLAILLAVVGFSVSLTSNVPPSEAAFGTSPPWVKNDHLLPGTTFEQIVNLSRNDPEDDMKVSVRVTGDKEIGSWLKIENQNRLIMKAGENILPMKVIVTVPKKAALKDYRGGIFVTLAPVTKDGQEGGTVAITLGANISVELSVVGDKISNYRIQSISVSPIDEGMPFQLLVELENTGNVDVTELNGQVDIYDEKESQVLKTLTFGALSSSVSPDDKGKVMIPFGDFVLDPGNYWAHVKVYKGKEVIYENRLYQQVVAKTIPVITPEAVLGKKPSVPRLPVPEGEIKDNVAPAPVVAEAPLMPAAPSPVNSMMLVFGFVGLGFGVLAMIGIIVVLIFIIRSQRQANLERYLASQMRNNLPQ